MNGGVIVFLGGMLIGLPFFIWFEIDDWRRGPRSRIIPPPPPRSAETRAKPVQGADLESQAVENKR